MTADDLPTRLARGVAALRAGRPRDALDDLAAVADDPDLAAAADLVDVRARALSLYAQALADAGRPADADAPCRAALGLLRRLRDREGLTEVRARQDRIVRAIAEARDDQARRDEARRVAATPVEVLLAAAATDAERVAALVRKAQAHVDAGEPDTAAELAQRALAAPDVDPTWRVFAHLALARARPDAADAHLRDAHAVATQASEHNLVSTVAHTARALGATLPVEPGPHLGQPERT